MTIYPTIHYAQRVPMKKIRLTTTLKLLRGHSACEPGYRKLLKSLGTKYPTDKPINLLHILKSNGLDDMAWCFRATEQNCDRVARLIAADFAESVLKYFTKQYPKDSRPALAIKAARDFANGKIDATMRDAAQAAAQAAAWAARVAAGDAAQAAAQAAAWDAQAAAQAAAWAARVAAGDAERQKQATIIRKYLR